MVYYVSKLCRLVLCVFDFFLGYTTLYITVWTGLDPYTRPDVPARFRFESWSHVHTSIMYGSCPGLFIWFEIRILLTGMAYPCSNKIFDWEYFLYCVVYGDFTPLSAKGIWRWFAVTELHKLFVWTSRVQG